MASTLGTERKEVRRLMRDTDGGRYAVSTRELNQIIESEMHAVGAEIRLGQAWQTAAITLDGRDPPDYTLPAAGVQYQQIIHLRRGYDKLLLDRLSQEQIGWIRRGIVTPRSSYVSGYALLEDTGQTVTVMFDRVNMTTDTIDMLRTIIPASLSDSDSAAIPFDRDLIYGFRRGCAFKGIDLMLPSEKQSRGFQGFVARGRYIPPAYVQDLMAAYQDSIKKAKIRIERMKRAGTHNTLLARDWLPGGLVPVR